VMSAYSGGFTECGERANEKRHSLVSDRLLGAANRW
jgi:hypothetical protein